MKLIHSDFHEGNIIIAHEKMYLIDFESVRYEDYFHYADLVRYYFDYSNHNLDIEPLSKFLSGKGLSKHEIHYLIRISVLRLILPYLGDPKNLAFLKKVLLTNQEFYEWMNIG
jgi:Ser/Thr protein kinase RdoA (MazF antagonist)